MSRISNRAWLFALILGLSSCGSLIPSAPLEYVETTEQQLRAVPAELLKPPQIPEKGTEATTIEMALERGAALRTYSCSLYHRYSRAIEYFTEGENTVPSPSSAQCPEGLDNESRFSIPFWN